MLDCKVSQVSRVILFSQLSGELTFENFRISFLKIQPAIGCTIWYMIYRADFWELLPAPARICFFRAHLMKILKILKISPPLRKVSLPCHWMWNTYTIGHLCVWYDSFTCVNRLVHMCHRTHCMWNTYTIDFLEFRQRSRGCSLPWPLHQNSQKSALHYIHYMKYL